MVKMRCFPLIQTYVKNIQKIFEKIKLEDPYCNNLGNDVTQNYNNTAMNATQQPE